jgi:hypothetical protein
MPNQKAEVLEQLQARFGQVHKLEGSQSLFQLGNGALIVYFRYSAVHSGNKAFYGLRRSDLRRLEGVNAVICFLWDNQSSPLFIPYADFEDVFAGASPASDGQYKVQVLFKETATELYIARTGRFGVDGYYGFDGLPRIIGDSREQLTPELSHAQVQSILAAIGSQKNCDVWLPQIDRSRLDCTFAPHVNWCVELAPCFSAIANIMSEVDVIWMERGSGRPRAMFEVEHSTPIYSGLLRFNDILISSRHITPTYAVVSNESRRSLFTRQVQRPTFVASGLSELCIFMRYDDVFSWYRRNHSVMPT